MRRRVHREGLDGTGDGNEAWRTAERRKQPCVRPAMFETGSCSSGGVWRTTKRRKQSSYSRNGGPVDREGCGVPQNGTPRDTIHLHRRPPLASTGYRRPPPASTGSCSSTVDLLQPPPATVHPRAPVHPPPTSSSVHRTLLHRLLFNQPSPRAPIQPPFHGLPFIQPSTVYCSSSPPRGPVHPAPTGSIDRGPVHPEATPRGPIHPEATPPLTVHPTPPPPQRSLFIPEAASIGFS